MTDMTRINWDGRAFFSPSAGIVVTPAEPEETDTATQAFQAGAQQAAAEHAAAKQDAAEKQVVSQYAQAGQQVLQNRLLGQLPTQGEIARQTLEHRYAKGLLGATDEYMAAQKAGDTAGMENAHQAADIIRKQAAEHGIDLEKSFGADKTPAQKQAMLNLYDEDMYAKLVAGGMSSGEYYHRMYDRGLKVGMSPLQANTFAGDQAAKYQAQRLADLKTAFYNYGIDGRNAITQDGAMLLNQIYDENPKDAMFAMTNFASPLSEYKYYRGEDASNNALDRGMKANEQQHGFNMAAMDKQGEWGVTLEGTRAKGDIARMEAKGRQDRETLETKGNVEIAVGKSNTANKIAVDNNTFNNHLTLAERYPGVFGGTKASEYKPTQKENERIQKYTNLLVKARNLISSKDDSKEQRETEDDAMKELNDYWEELQREGVLDTDTLDTLYMDKVQPETIAGVNALASEYFKRTGKKLLLNSLAGGSHPSNASAWGHAAGWKADIDNTGVDTKVFLDICEKLGIGAALEKDTHFDLSFGKGNAYMSTDQGTSDRTGSRWYEAYHSGKANTSTESSQSETKRTPPIDINKLFAGIGENSAFGRTFFDAFTRDVGDSTTNENLLVTLEKMKNVRGQFMNTKKNREALAAAFPQELQAYAMQLMQAAPETTNTRQTAEHAPRPMGRTRPQAEAAPHIEEAPMPKSVREVLQAEPPKAEAMDGGRSLTRSMGMLEESTAPNEPQNTQQAPQNRAGGAESMPQGKYTQPAKGALQGEASAAEGGRFQPAGRMQSPAAAMAKLQTPGMQPDTRMQQERRLPAEGGHLQPGSKVTMQPAEQPVKRSAALEQRTRPEVQQQSGSVQQGAEMPPVDTVRQQREAAYRAQGAAESTQQAPTAGMQTEPTARQEGQMPTVTPTAADIVLLDAMSPAANAKAGRRHQGRALMQLARKHAVKLPAGVIKLLGEGSSKKAIRAAQQALQAAGVRMPAKEERGHAEKTEQKNTLAAGGTYAAMEEGTAKEHANPSDEQLRQQETPEEVAAAEAKETEGRAGSQKSKRAKGRLGKGLTELLQEDPGEQRKVLNRSLFRGRLSEKTLNESRGDAFRDVVEMSLAAQKAKKTSAETEARGEEAERKEEMQEAAKERGEEAPKAQAEYAEARESEPAEGAAEETEAKKKPAESEHEEHEEGERYTLPEGYHTESGRDVLEADAQEFILDRDNRKAMGYISQDVEDATDGAIKAGRVSLQVGNIKFGYIHIINRHDSQIAGKGYDVITYVRHILQNFTQVYRQAERDGENHKRFVLYCEDKTKGFMPLDLVLVKGSENFYTVVSAMPHKKKIKATLIYDGGANPSSTITDRPLIRETDKNGEVGSSRNANEKINVTSSATNITQKAEERNGEKGDKNLARQTKKDRLIYSSPGLDAATAPGDSAVSHDGKAGTVNRGGSPTSDKSSDLSVSSVTKKAEEHNGEKGDAVKYSAVMDDAEEAIKSAAKDARAALDRLAAAMGGKVTDGKRAFQAAKDKARFDRAARAFLYAADGNVQALDHVQGVRYSVAWHGSPHTFDTFKLRHIGSGEGAQAHGWGLYFAKGREVAEKYQKRLLQFLPPFRYIYDGKPFSSYKGQLGKILTYFSDRTFTEEEMSEEASLWAEHAEEELRRQEEKASMYDGVLSAYKKNPNISIEEMREIAMQDTTTDVSSYLLLNAIRDAEYSAEGRAANGKRRGGDTKAAAKESEKTGNKA